MTNADRIRSMTGEELTTWLMNMQSCPYELYQDCQQPKLDCRSCVDDWLKQGTELSSMIASCEKAGVKVEKKDSGEINIDGSITTPQRALESFFTRTKGSKHRSLN